MPTFYAPGTRKGNRFYVVRGSINGREREIPTETRDKRVAQRAWDAFKAAVKERERTEPEPCAPATFGSVADAYLSVATRSKSDRRYIKRLVGRLGAMPIGSVTQMDVHAAAALYPDGTAATRNRQAVAPAAAVLHSRRKADCARGCE